jgi:hypothetical protein
MSIIIRGYTDQMKSATSFLYIWFYFVYCIYSSMFRVLLFNCVNGVFLLLCMFLGILFHCVVLCIVCV